MSVHPHIRRCIDLGWHAALLARVVEQEARANVYPCDPDLHAFLASGTYEGQRHSPSTLFMLRILGLEVRLHACASDEGGGQAGRS